jgi:hypothetical protein
MFDSFNVFGGFFKERKGSKEMLKIQFQTKLKIGDEIIKLNKKRTKIPNADKEIS